MGKQISKFEYQMFGLEGLLKPIFFCCLDEELSQRAISLNVQLAEKLLAVKPQRRSIKLDSIVAQVLDALPPRSIIKDIDVLFNPAYQVDVLRVLIGACRRNEFSIIWPGKLSKGKLIYAEPGYSDYQSFDLEKYDITCIV